MSDKRKISPNIDTKNKKRVTKFDKDWLKEIDQLIGGCVNCLETIFTVHHEGVKALRAHANSLKHKTNSG